jgi:hypothetical protein
MPAGMSLRIAPLCKFPFMDDNATFSALAFASTDTFYLDTFLPQEIEEIDPRERGDHPVDRMDDDAHLMLHANLLSFPPVPAHPAGKTHGV